MPRNRTCRDPKTASMSPYLFEVKTEALRRLSHDRHPSSSTLLNFEFKYDKVLYIRERVELRDKEFYLRSKPCCTVELVASSWITTQSLCWSQGHKNGSFEGKGYACSSKVLPDFLVLITSKSPRHTLYIAMLQIG